MAYLFLTQWRYASQSVPGLGAVTPLAVLAEVPLLLEEAGPRVTLDLPSESKVGFSNPAIKSSGHDYSDLREYIRSLKAAAATSAKIGREAAKCSSFPECYHID